MAYPIKGTGLYSQIEDQIITKPQWSKSTDRDIDFKRTYSRKFYNYVVNHVVNEVNAAKEFQQGNTIIGMKLKGKSMVAQLLMSLYQ